MKNPVGLMLFRPILILSFLFVTLAPFSNQASAMWERFEEVGRPVIVIGGIVIGGLSCGLWMSGEIQNETEARHLCEQIYETHDFDSLRACQLRTLNELHR